MEFSQSTTQQRTQAGSGLLSRRNFLSHTSTALSSVALAALLAEEGLLAEEPPKSIRPQIDPAQPHASRKSHFAARAKNVLMIFCSGACSHLDTFDYKPQLVKRHGEPLPGNEKLITFQGEQGALTKSPYPFRPRGESGKMISDLVGQIGELADDLCFIHSLTTKTNTHGPGENAVATGFTLDGFPSMGAWITYALGSENRNLPAYVAIPDPRGAPQSSVNFWGPGFLPATFQGVDFNAAKPIRNLARPKSISAQTDQATRNFLQQINRLHLQRFPGDSELAARIASYELAARMQLSVPEVSDINREPAHILKMYGADDAQNKLKLSLPRTAS